MTPAVRAILFGAPDVDALLWKQAIRAVGADVSAARLGQVSALIRGLKVAGLWEVLDRLWLHTPENPLIPGPGLVDLKARATATAVNSPTWSSLGVAGNGSTSYIDSGYAPATNGVNFALNSASFFNYVRTGRTAGASAVTMGANVSGAPARLFPKYGDAKIYLALNGAEDSVAGPTTVAGMWVCSRTSSTAEAIYQNGALFTTFSRVSTTLQTGSVYIGASHEGGPLYFSTDQIAVSGMAGGLDATKAAALSAALNAYMSAIGGAVY